MAYQNTGFVSSFASASFDVSGTKFYGIRSCNWKEELSGEIVYAAGPEPYGQTFGEYKATGDVEIIFSEYSRFLQKLGPGFMQKSFNFGGTWRETPGDGVHKVEWLNCRIIGSESSNATGSAAAVVKVSLNILSPIKFNGLTAIDRLYATGAVGNPATGVVTGV